MKDKTLKINLRILWYFFSAMAFSIICVGGYNPYFMKLRNLLFAWLVCSSCFVAVLVRKKITLDMSWVLFFFTAIYMVFSAALSMDADTGFKIAGYYVIGSIVLMIEYSDQMIELILKCIKIFVLIIALSIIISVPVDDCMNRYFSWLLNPTHDAAVAESIRNTILYSHSYAGFAKEKSVAAYIMGMGICIYLGKYFSGEKLKKKEIFGLFLEIFALVLTAKRMIPVCLLVVFLIMIFSSKMQEKILKMIMPFLTVVVLFAVSWFIPSVRNIFLRFTNSTADLLTGRSELWTYSLKMFMKSPLFGTGLGSFNEFAAEQGYLNASGERWNYYGHNCYLEFLGELGLIGFMLIAGALLYMLVRSFLLVRDPKLEQKERFYVFFAFAVELMLLLYSISGNVLLYADQTLALFFAFSIIRSISIRHGAYKKRR